MREFSSGSLRGVLIELDGSWRLVAKLDDSDEESDDDSPEESDDGSEECSGGSDDSGGRPE